MDSQKRESVINLLAGNRGRYHVRSGSVLDLSRELMDIIVDDQGLTVSISVTEHSCELDANLPPLVFEHVGVLEHVG